MFHKNIFLNFISSFTQKWSNYFFQEFVKNRDLDLFKKWKFIVDIEDAKKLAHEGEEEMLLMAERMQSRFPELFDSAYSNTSYRVSYILSMSVPLKIVNHLFFIHL